MWLTIVFAPHIPCGQFGFLERMFSCGISSVGQLIFLEKSDEGPCFNQEDVP
ncbi:MAG: hypothetical protein ACOY4D_09780 [Pseudomonadota bacterium]